MAEGPLKDFDLIKFRNEVPEERTETVDDPLADLRPVLPRDFKHRPPLSDDELQEIRSKLRPVESQVAVLQLPPPGEDLIPYLREQLAKRGYDQTHFLRRAIQKDRVPIAIQTGTDRDISSRVEYHGGHDGERLAMIEHGLNPDTDAELVTYVKDIDLSNGKPWIRPTDTGFAALIYAPDAIQYIHPSTGTTSNGFAAFRDRKLIQPSLLAVLTPEPDKTFSLNTKKSFTNSPLIDPNTVKVTRLQGKNGDTWVVSPFLRPSNHRRFSV